MFVRLPFLLFMSAATVLTVGAQEAPSVTGDAADLRPGHSAHGPAFDTGPRQKPWKFNAIGFSHFPVTSSNAEVQQWFDQGHTLLHSYWSYEAERAFRWCLRLDPDCAMAYWGLARATTGDRRDTFLREAVKRKDKVTERERLYIEAWAERWLPPANVSGPKETAEQRNERLRSALQKICIRYPQDIEAQALYAQASIGVSARYGIDAVLQNILAQNPRHPGALHYRIHIWDKREPEYILNNSALYGSIAKDVAHGQHMVGHIYSGVGMWHEAAYYMDHSNRSELAYMRDHQMLPYYNWSYAHNRNFLSYVQEQLGMAEAAIRGAQEMHEIALDPEFNDPAKSNVYLDGTVALLRALLKFGRWNTVLDPRTFIWSSSFRDRLCRSYAEASAYTALHQFEKAQGAIDEHSALRTELERPENKDFKDLYDVQVAELQALMRIARGEPKQAIEQLQPLISKDLENRRLGDPPVFGNVLATLAGYAALSAVDPSQAITFFERTLEVVPNDGFALAGLVRAHALLGQRAQAERAMGRLQFVWSNADPNLPWFNDAKEAGITAKPLDASPAAQRTYSTSILEKLGTDHLEPFSAPNLRAMDTEGKEVTLEEYRGRNVLLIFYLGQECPRCVQQLVEIAKRTGEFSARGTEVLAISPHSPSTNATFVKSGNIRYRLLSDENQSNARRFGSYDDFEDMQLHSTVLIDKCGRVYWARNGGEPFTQFDFLLKEIDRLNASQTPTVPGLQISASNVIACTANGSLAAGGR